MKVNSSDISKGIFPFKSLHFVLIKVMAVNVNVTYIYLRQKILYSGPLLTHRSISIIQFNYLTQQFVKYISGKYIVKFIGIAIQHYFNRIIFHSAVWNLEMSLRMLRIYGFRCGRNWKQKEEIDRWILNLIFPDLII